MREREVAPGVWRLPFASRTLPPFDHTNGWLLVDADDAVLVDPGFRDGAGLTMLDAALGGAGVRSLSAIWLTHAHRDHTEGLGAALRAWPHAEVVVHAHEAHRLDARQPARGSSGGVRLRVLGPLQEHDRTAPGDVVPGSADGGAAHVGATGVAEGAVFELAVGRRRARAVHTPGHSPGHLSFVLEDVGWVFAGDLVAGHGSVWVGAPDGDLGAYLRSLERLRVMRPAVLAPGHGDPRSDADAALIAARDHRLQREAQVLSAVQDRSMSVPEIRVVVYPLLDPALVPLAERTLVAHLDKLLAEGRVTRAGGDADATYRASERS